MTEKSLNQEAYKTAAVRVQFWFGRAAFFEDRSKQSKDFSKKYKCDQIPTLKVPTQIACYVPKRKQKPKKREVTKENGARLPISIEENSCDIYQKDRQEVSLSSRVMYRQLKEHLFLSKKLKVLSKQTNSGPKKHEVTSMQSEKKESALDNPYLQEWGRIKEERHFQIGRVIKYLVD